MSTNQVKSDTIDPQLKRGGRGGPVYRVAGPAKGGGPGGPSHPSSASHAASTHHHTSTSHRPTAPQNPNARRRANGVGWQPANGEPILQQTHRPQFPGTPSAGSFSSPGARRPAATNIGGTTFKQTSPPVAVTAGMPLESPLASPKESAGPPPAVTFQFGSFTPGFVHNAGVQIPARTSSAPPNLDEQKREQAQFEAARKVVHHGPVLDHISPQSQPQMHMTPPLAASPAPLPVRQLPLQMVASQTPPQQLPHGIVSQGFSQGAKFQQPPPPAVMASQVATALVGPQMVPHQMAPGPIGNQMQPGIPITQYAHSPFIQPRTNKAIRIVNPQTYEEVRFDVNNKSSAALGSQQHHQQQQQQQARAGAYPGPQMNVNPQGMYTSSGMSYYPQNANPDSQRFSTYIPQIQPQYPRPVPHVLKVSPASSNVGADHYTASRTSSQEENADAAAATSSGLVETVNNVENGVVEKVVDIEVLPAEAAVDTSHSQPEQHAPETQPETEPVPVPIESLESSAEELVQEETIVSPPEFVETTEESVTVLEVVEEGKKGSEIDEASIVVEVIDDKQVDIVEVSPESDTVTSVEDAVVIEKTVEVDVVDSEKTMDTPEINSSVAVSSVDAGVDDVEKRNEDEQHTDDVDVKEEESGCEVDDVSISSSVGDKQGSGVSQEIPNSDVVKQGHKKKDKKKMLAKADAAGSTADLYHAYKAPDDKKLEEVKPSDQQEEVKSSSLKTETLEQEEVSNKEEVDDWEDAADLPAPSPKIYSNDSDKKYTRDFLLTFRDHHLDLPHDFEVRPDIAEFLLASVHGEYPSSGGRAGNPRLERRGSVDEDRWARQPITPRGQDMRVDMGMGTPMGGFRPGGIMPGTPGMRPPFPMMIPGMMGMMPPMGTPRGVDGDRWTHLGMQKGLFPSPALPAIHRTENRYEVGKVTDEEASKQRQIKSILNKLTPQNFEKLFVQAMDVNIDTAYTLTGVISQIFDKALMEPTFCEMYAVFCVRLSIELPEFIEEEQKITFKRVLLNKCQEEFERGKREEEEAEKVNDGEDDTSAAERESKRSQARRRMLGNIRFIGELYKKSMLTERIMHECIKTLLGEFQCPEEENVEALCKLMSTIGHMIDHEKAKPHIDAYFSRIYELSNSMKLPSRLRFGLKDVIDLRRNGWHERRKIEGPKKIDEVHRDAAQERLAQASGSRDRFQRGGGMNMNRRAMSGVSPMTSGGSRGMGNRQDVRMGDPFSESRAMPVPLVQRTGDESLTLVPQGGLTRASVGRSAAPTRNATPEISNLRRPVTAPGVDRGSYGGREEFSSRPTGHLSSGETPILQRPSTAEKERGREGRNLERVMSDKILYSSDRPSTPPTPAPLPVPVAEFTEDQLKSKSDLAIKEYFSARDEKEAAQCVEELRNPDFHSTMLSRWISESLERKDVERNLLVQLILHLKSLSPPLITPEQLTEGLTAVMSMIEDMVVDAPKAPEYIGSIVGKLVAGKAVSLQKAGELIKEGGMEKDGLLLSGDALKIFAFVLDTLRSEKDEAHMLELYKSSGLDIREFVLDVKPGTVESFLDRKKLLCLVPVLSIESYLKDALERDEAIADISNWFQENVPTSLHSDHSFLRMVMTEVLKHTVLPLPAQDVQASLKGKTSKFAKFLQSFTKSSPKNSAANQRQYIVAVQLFAHSVGHPHGLMTALFENFYEDEVIGESAYFKWQDDVADTTPGRDKAIREVGKWLKWLEEAPEEE